MESSKLYSSYDQTKIVRTHTDDLLASHQYDASLVISEKPIVIDAGSTAYDEKGQLHKDACGFIALSAALQLMVAVGKIQGKFAERITKLEFSFDKLKLLLGIEKNVIIRHDDRIAKEDFDILGKCIGVKIIIREPGCRSVYGRKRNCPIVHLYYALSHYTVLIDGLDETQCVIYATGQDYPIVDLAKLYSEIYFPSDPTFDAYIDYSTIELSEEEIRALAELAISDIDEY